MPVVDMGFVTGSVLLLLNVPLHAWLGLHIPSSLLKICNIQSGGF